MYKNFFKRFLDILLSGMALVVLSPIILICAILVRFKLGSPVIHKATRITKGEKEFMMYKFRSMTNEKDENGELLPDADRLTSFGRKIRALSIDELPELWNIFIGDMSIVGPRPLPKSYLPYYTEEERKRHNVRAGLTGLAQVNGRNSLSWEDKFAYDISYVENITFLGDLKILFKTVEKVLKRSDIGQGEQTPVSLNVEREKCR